jgi:hypothetical protein
MPNGRLSAAVWGANRLSHFRHTSVAPLKQASAKLILQPTDANFRQSDDN